MSTFLFFSVVLSGSVVLVLSSASPAAAWVGNETDINNFMWNPYRNNATYDIGYFGSGTGTQTVTTNTEGTRATVDIKFEVWYGAARPAQFDYRALNTTVYVSGVDSVTRNRIVSGGPPPEVIHPSKNSGATTAKGHKVVYSGPYSTIINTEGLFSGAQTTTTRTVCVRFSSYTNRPGAVIQPPDSRCQAIKFTIPYDYSLTPSVTLDKTIADAGATLQVDAKIGNSGTTKTNSIDWQLSYITIPAGDSTPPTGTSANTSTPCAYYKSKVATITCDIATFTDGDYITATGTNVFSFTSGTYSFSPRIATVPDLSVGKKLCYALSVKPYASNSTDWRHSSLACAVIGKHPVLQTYGGDVIVGRDGSSPASKIITSTKTVSGKRYGSWGEYGVIAAGSVSGMASASGYAGGVTPTDICGVSYLTLNNRTNPTSTCSASTLGSYTYGAAPSTVANRFAITSTTPQKSGDVTISSLSSGTTYTNNASGSEIRLTMGSSATLPAGKWVVINAPDATVKIMGDLRYTTGALTKLSDIPQIVIIAKNIIVSDSVEQIDAWLVATGTGAEGRINTCGAGRVTEASAITSMTCDKKLTVNGPAIANHLVLRRTAGAGTGAESGYPAEVFNLRPDSYLWALSLQTSTPKAQTVQTVELPPRY